MPDAGIEDLLAAEPLARRALAEITPEATIGAAIGHVVEGEGVVSLLFESTLPGYPGWRWTVTVGRAEEDAAPTVLEAELMPAEGALLAPDWVPWSERLADYQAAQEALAAEAAEHDESDEDASDEDDEDDESDDGEYEDDGDDESDDSDDDDDDDFDDDSDDDHDVHDLHGDDDLDGVDIDSLHAEAAVDPSFDEDTDSDTELDLPAEEAAALEEPVDSAVLAAGEGEVAEAEDAEDDSDDDRPEPDAADGEDQHGDQG